MAHQDLVRLLHDLSVDMSLRRTFDSEREKVLGGANLSDEEKDLVRRNDVIGINRYLYPHVRS